MQGTPGAGSQSQAVVAAALVEMQQQQQQQPMQMQGYLPMMDPRAGVMMGPMGLGPMAGHMLGYSLGQPLAMGQPLQMGQPLTAPKSAKSTAAAVQREKKQQEKEAELQLKAIKYDAHPKTLDRADPDMFYRHADVQGPGKVGQSTWAHLQRW